MEIVRQKGDQMPYLKVRMRQKIVAAVVAFLVIAAFASLLIGGEPIRITKPSPGIHTLRLTSTSATADITWEAVQPLTIEWLGPFDLGTAIVVNFPKEGVYVLASDVIDWDARKRDKTQYIVTVGKAPDITPPSPDVVPPAPDTTDKAPLPNLSGFKVLLIYESSDLTVPFQQMEIRMNPEVRSWLTTNTTPETNERGTWSGWRLGDPDQGVAETNDTWEQMLALPRASLPWLIINDGTRNRGYSGPMPADSAKMLELLRKFK